MDAYYDAEGAPVLVNVYAHLFSSAEDVSDRVYYTDAATVARLGPPAEEFLAETGRRARLADFPVHTELRIDASGRVAPIEVNPMRFGGWCATDLAHFAHGVNPYRCYLLGERPDWARIAAETAGRTTALIVADLPSTVDLAAIDVCRLRGLRRRASATCSSCARLTTTATRCSRSPSSRSRPATSPSCTECSVRTCGST